MKYRLVILLWTLLFPAYICGQDANKRPRGYRGYFETGYVVGTGCTDTYDFTISNGYCFSPSAVPGTFFIGFGVGYNVPIDEPRVAVMPAFFDLRYDFSYWRIGRRCYPYLNMKAGVKVVTVDGFWDADKYLCPSAGVKWELGRKTSLNFSVGYSAKYLKGVEFKVGFGF